MPQLLKVKSLATFNNELNLPEGSLVVADNIVIDQSDVARPRRGFKDYGDTLPLVGDRVKQLLTYKNRILRHFNTTLQFDDGAGTFSAFNGSYSELETGLRIKYLELKGNLYFTTTDGIKKISATSASDFSTASGYITQAGGAKALDLNGVIEISDAGFMQAQSKVAYRLVFGIRDANNNLILGSPSSRLVITNPHASLACNVNLVFPLPTSIDNENFFYQVYRSAVSTTLPLDDNDPGDELNLVYESSITSADISAGEITVVDETPETFRESGTILYTNPVTGDGITSANERPPIAKDIALFRGTAFYSNTETIHRKTITLLGVGDFTSGVSNIVIGNSSVTRTYTFIGATQVADITTVADVANSLQNKYFLINSASNERKYFVWFNVSGGGVEPVNAEVEGRIPVAVAIATGDAAGVVATALKVALDALDDFDASVLADVVTVTYAKNGNSITPVDATAGADQTGFTFLITTAGDGEDAASNEVLLSSLISAAQSIDESARSLVNIINQDNTGIVYAYYLSGPSDLPGVILLENRDLTDDAFFIGTEDSAIPLSFNPELSVSRSIVAIGVNDEIETSTNHGFASNDKVYFYGTDSTPSLQGAFYVKQVVSVTEFKVSETKGGAVFDITIAGTTGSVFYADVESDNEEAANRIYYSKYEQPEAVPIVNFFDVGPKDKAIYRILSLRDSLFVLKEDGVYLITGNNGNFAVRLIDSSIQIIAPDTAVSLNNQIYMLSNQGVARISDTGAVLISNSIDDKISGVILKSFNYKYPSFGIAYENDRAYMIWLPTLRTDTVATQCFRFNIDENTWVRWIKTNSCGVINPEDDKLYLGCTDRNYIEQERKNFDRTDYADREIPLSIPPNAFNDLQMSISSLVNTEVGDMLVQDQYVTIAKFNRLLMKLDMDNGLDDSDYYSTLGIEAGSNLTSSMNALVAKLNADDSVVYVFSGATDFATIKTEYNTIIATLNSAPSDTLYKDYTTITDLIQHETIITEVNTSTNRLGLSYVPPFLEGDITLFKGYSKVIQWAPQSFGDAEVMKQVSEGTLVFDGDNFYSASVAYSTDLSTNFEEIEFNGQGTGAFGQFQFGEVTFGGEGSDVPLRTWIPQQKQRCRYINVKFSHYNAREDFDLLGITLKVRPLSTRAYR